MQYAVYDHASEFMNVFSTEQLGIAGNGIQGNVCVSGKDIALAIVEAYVVGVVVMAYELAVDTQDFLVVDEDIVDVACLLAVGSGHSAYPCRGCLLVDGRHGDIDGVVGNHSVC